MNLNIYYPFLGLSLSFKFSDCVSLALSGHVDEDGMLQCYLVTLLPSNIVTR